MDFLRNNPIASAIIVGVVVIAGAIVTIVHPETLSFEDYVKDVAVGGGLLAVGRGIDNHGKK
jgi:hypothetical protein